VAVISRSSGRCGIDASSASAMGNVLVVKSAKTTNTAIAPWMKV
jgi:hypothetical protein